jgi:hypothetical protein
MIWLGCLIEEETSVPSDLWRSVVHFQEEKEEEEEEEEEEI